MKSGWGEAGGGRKGGRSGGEGGGVGLGRRMREEEEVVTARGLGMGSEKTIGDPKHPIKAQKLKNGEIGARSEAMTKIENE